MFISEFEEYFIIVARKVWSYHLLQEAWDCLGPEKEVEKSIHSSGNYQVVEGPRGTTGHEL